MFSAIETMLSILNEVLAAYLLHPSDDIRSIHVTIRIPGTRNEYMSPEYSHQQVISVSDDRDMETATQNLSGSKYDPVLY